MASLWVTLSTCLRRWHGVRRSSCLVSALHAARVGTGQRPRRVIFFGQKCPLNSHSPLTTGAQSFASHCFCAAGYYFTTNASSVPRQASTGSSTDGDGAPYPAGKVGKGALSRRCLPCPPGTFAAAVCHREVLADIAWVLPAASRADQAVALPCRHSEPHQPGGSAAPDLHGWAPWRTVPGPQAACPALRQVSPTWS